MKTPSLTLARLKELLEYNPEDGFFRWRVERRRHAGKTVIGSQAGYKNKQGYLVIGLDGKLYSAHRLAWFYMTGDWPTADTDHKNRNRVDNRFSNLRSASRAENLWNSGPHKDSKSGIKGIRYDVDRQKWRASIYVNGRERFLGRFALAADAQAAYRQAALVAHSDFAPIE